MTKATQLRVVTLIAATWIVLLPPFWAWNLSVRFAIPYFEFLAFYVPELVVAAVSLVLLPAAWMLQRWVVGGLVAAAVLLPALKFAFGSPSVGTWFISSALLLLVAY